MISVNDEGSSKITSFNDWQFENDSFPIELTWDGIFIFFNDEHPLKVLSPMNVIDGGKMISFNDEHLSKP